MAANLGSSRGELHETHEINVTPFIDVMLVLLIIFMVAAPLATVDLPVDLPASNAAPHERPEKPVLVDRFTRRNVTREPAHASGAGAPLSHGGAGAAAPASNRAL